MAAIVLEGEAETTPRPAAGMLSGGRGPTFGRQAVVDDLEGADWLGQL